MKMKKPGLSISQVLVTILLLLFGVSWAEKPTVCKDLNCINIDHGNLIHYEIYSKPECISLKTYVCAWEVTRCSFFKNIVWQTWKGCDTDYETISIQACLLMGRTLQSVDGNLQRKTVSMYSTDNKISETYS